MPYSKLRNFGRSVLVASGLLVFVAGSVAAQVANQSDITGIPITSSSVVSPVFTVSVGGAVRVITFITPQIATWYQQAAARVNAQLASQTFATRDGFRPPATTQNLLYEVASDGPGSAQASTQLVNLLTTDNASPAAVANAEAFVEAFRGLLAKGLAMNPRFFNSLTATQLANTVAAYNAFVDSSSEPFLTSPPAELVAIRGILAQLTTR
ncbi:MAG TPA: hypothetical protein VIJ16_06740 [Gemmatimonadaceae bacterium]